MLGSVPENAELQGEARQHPRDESNELPPLPKLPPKPKIQDEWTFDDFSDEDDEPPEAAVAPSVVARPPKQPKNTFGTVVVESIHRLVQNISTGYSSMDAD